MKNYTVSYELRKGSNYSRHTASVKAESDFMAVKQAEGKARSQNPSKFSSGYEFNLIEVR
ncbi:hypothetical protein [Burkholderia cepacia]|uniref:Uncharacterized protein n=1 Tax=Burkholderia cepacia TaxID=292 RepID=A0A105XFA8_BURCE|nr:hypothetical protein [Burkholderia cepacia]AIO28511.1 hypothetical protein DM41_3908 [Burkholderia cepacia ATCC 25416]ALK21424.1 hypothetical protein APZ15_27125 [Burkholderia cepacia ATCC 25416]ASE98502.1 hypothetical protein CEQ23_34765 [Burkholderia cepacia]ATF83237.1 hypothetical protein CO711_39530 [Burkholderia cepacia]KUY70287.1 hypothetical protein WI27_04070 [Burkholderia cepacia]